MNTDYGSLGNAVYFTIVSISLVVNIYSLELTMTIFRPNSAWGSGKETMFQMAYSMSDAFCGSNAEIRNHTSSFF